MGWTISFPNPMPQPGEELCVTITGGSGHPPEVSVSFDENPPLRIRVVKHQGGNTYVVCFTLPLNYGSGTITASSRDGTSFRAF